MRETCLVKFYASRVADEVPNPGLDVPGAYRYSNVCAVAQILPDGKVYEIVEGAANTMEMILAADAPGIEKANRD